MEDLRLAIKKCGLSNLGFQGDKYTWYNNREGSQFTKERLKRAFGNSRWHDLFANTTVRIEATQTSDHRSLIITMDSRVQGERGGERPFRYEAKCA